MHKKGGRQGEIFLPKTMKKCWVAHQGPTDTPNPERPTQRPDGLRLLRRRGRGLGRRDRISPAQPTPRASLTTPRASCDCEAGAAASPSSLLLPRPPGSIGLHHGASMRGSLRIKAITISGWLTVMLLKHILPTHPLSRLPTPALCFSYH